MRKSHIGKYLDDLLQELRLKATPAFTQWDADAIHDARVCTRRLSAATKLLANLHDDTQTNSFSVLMKRLRRRLGPLRDLDVMIDHVQDIRARGFSLALPWAIRQMKQEREVLRGRLGVKTGPLRDLATECGWWSKVNDLDARAAALLARHIPELLAWFDNMASALLASRNGMASATDNVPNRSVPSEADEAGDSPRLDPHQLRIVGKELRYCLEIARVNGLKLPAEVFKTFKRLQDSLGLWHDHVVLGERVLRLAVDAELACHDSAVFGETLLLARHIWRRAERHLSAFLSRWHDRGPVISGQVRECLSPAPLKEPALPPSPAEPYPSISANPQASLSPTLPG